MGSDGQRLNVPPALWGLVVGRRNSENFKVDLLDEFFLQKKKSFLTQK